MQARSSMCVLVLALALLVCARANAQPPTPVAIEAESLFGRGTLLPNGHLPILVTLTNPRSQDLHGEVELSLWSYNGMLARHRARVDLPAREERQLRMTIFVDPNASEIRISFEGDGRIFGTAVRGFDYAGDARSLVVIGDPPRLRGALTDLDVADPSLGRDIRAPLGVVGLDPRNGDPMLPASAAGWSTVHLVVASAPVLARANATQRRALADWLRTGGRLVVFPRSAHDFEDPWLRALAGPSGSEMPPGDAFVPPTVERFPIGCSRRQRVERFGCSAAVGFGRLYLVSYDATPAAIESGAPRELVKAIYSSEEPMRSTLAFARGRDSLSDGGAGFDAVRRLLDPNEGFRPALALVALVLLLYVIVLGPINFRWVQRKNRPTLALVTTPIAAFACLLALLTVGYVGKGVRMRHRRVELVQGVEGERRVPSRRYTGLYSTRPGSFDLPPTSGGVGLRISESGERGPVYWHEGARVRPLDFRAGLWETTFVREDRIVDLGGSLRFVRDGRRLAAVQNRSRVTLTHAFVVDMAGALYMVGRIVPGATAPIPRLADLTIGTWTTGEILANAVHCDRAHAELLVGITEGNLTPVGAPVLYARIESSAATIGDTFSPERDVRWLRLVPSLRGSPVRPPAPPQTSEDSAGAAAAEVLRAHEDEPLAGAPDAGVSP